jgi:transcriptional regulator NrdR family protein
MKCPACKGETFVRETRSPIRRRQCSECGHRFMTVEQLYNPAHGSQVASEPKERKPKTVVAPPTIQETKSKAKKRAEARRKIEERNIEREYKSYNDNWYEEDTNYLPDRW